MNTEDIRYPIGTYQPQAFSHWQRQQWLIDIAQLPAMAEAAVHNLDAAQLHLPYRPGGWSIHQIVHHLADSHTNAWCRIKLVLTEDNPTIRPYHQDAWVQQADTLALPINNATTMLHALHQRIYTLLKAVEGGTWQRTYIHPESGQHTLWYLMGMYAWHGRHHVAQINRLREQQGWY